MSPWARWRLDRIDRIAARWVARLHGPDAARGRAAFERWRDADPRHAAAYRDAALFYETSAHARPITEQAARTSARGDRLGWHYAMAALVAIVLAGSAALLFKRMHGAMVTQHETLASTDSERGLLLADGSKIMLAPNSALRVDFDGALRRVRLIGGAALFTVAHDAYHPFVVTASDRQVIARGTRFRVAMTANGLAVTMLEGVVEVSPVTAPIDAPAPVRLIKGQELTISRGVATISARAIDRPADKAAIGANIDTSATSSTRLGVPSLHDFAATPLASVVALANTDAAKPIVIEDATIGALRVDGRLDTADTRSLARVLALALSLEVRDDGKQWILARKT